MLFGRKIIKGNSHQSARHLVPVNLGLLVDDLTKGLEKLKKNTGNLAVPKGSSLSQQITVRRISK